MNKFCHTACFLLAMLLIAPLATAGPFHRTKHFNGDYLLGVCSLTEYDENVWYAEPTPEITFFPDGTVDLGGLYQATYTRRAGTVTVTYIPPADGYVSVVHYVFYRLGGSNYWGEIYFDGILYGIMRGRITN